MKLTRREDWPLRLDRAIAAARGQRFEWGVHDCCQFVAAVVRAMTDIDFGAAWLGRYHDADSAARALITLGADSLEDLVDSLLGRPVAPAAARRGDVMAFPTPQGPALGICCGRRTAFVSEAGLGFVPTLQCLRGWRVG